jgi:hypothetical protein
MTAIIAIVFAAMNLCADPTANDHDAIRGVWYGTRLLTGFGIEFTDNTIFATDGLTFVRLNGATFRARSGKIVIEQNGQLRHGLYCIDGDKLTLMLAQPSEKLPDSLQAHVIAWEELTRSIPDRLKRGENPDKVLASMPDWYLKLWFFQREPSTK